MTSEIVKVAKIVTFKLMSPAHLSSSFMIFVENDRSIEDLRRAYIVGVSVVKSEHRKE